MKYKKIILSIKILSICATLFLINNYLSKINFYEINKIIVKGNNFILADDIIQVVKKSINNNLFNLEVKNIQNHVNKSPFIKGSKIYTILPSNLIIEIKEIIPLAIIEYNNNIYFIDQNSNHIKADNNSLNHFNVPIITNYLDYKSNNIPTDILKMIRKHNSNFYDSINE